MDNQLLYEITNAKNATCFDVDCNPTDYKHEYILTFYNNYYHHHIEITEHPFYVTLGHFDKCIIRFFYDSKQELKRYMILPLNYDKLNITDISNQLYREYMINKLNGEIALYHTLRC